MPPRCECRMKVNSKKFTATFNVGTKQKFHRLQKPSARSTLIIL